MNGCNLEWQPSIRDFQWGTGPVSDFPADMVGVAQAVADVDNAPLEPGSAQASVRATFDSRLINSYDFTNTAPSVAASPSTLWTVGWQVPLGYRAVIRKFKVMYDGDMGGPAGNSVVVPLQTLYPSLFLTVLATNSTFAAAGNGVALSNNGWVTVGAGDEFETFFIVEEGTWYGLTGQNDNLQQGGGNNLVSVNVYGTLIPTNQLELSYCIGNPIND